MGQIQIHYSKPIVEILSSTRRAPWTRARMSRWTIQGHEAFEYAQGHGGQLPTATTSHEYQKQRSADGGSAIDARFSAVG